MESGIEPSVDLETLDERIKIREMILKGQIQEAISLINSLHPELLDTNRYLYFHLQVRASGKFIFVLEVVKKLWKKCGFKIVKGFVAKHVCNFKCLFLMSFL